MKKLLFCVLILVLCIPQVCPVLAAHRLVTDGADLLSASEEAALAQQLEAISMTHQVDVAVMTVTSTGGLSPDDYINTEFDDAFGPNHDGVLLVVDMGSRTFRILSNGVAAAAITMDHIEEYTDRMTPYLSDGDYAAAFQWFAEQCAYDINGYMNGFPFPVGQNLLIALAVGLVIALIVTGIMRGQLKSVRRQPAAEDYMKQGSMKLQVRHDIFLYRNVTRRAKPKNNSSSGSSSGGSRNVGGGRF